MTLRSNYSKIGELRLLNDVYVADWSNPPRDEPGVYEIRLSREAPRICGSSDILYIGKAKKLKTRMDQLKREEHHVSPRVLRLLRNDKAWPAATERFCTVWTRTTPEAENDPDLEEVRLLTAFEREHCELPPLNRSAPGDLSLLVLQRVMQGMTDQLTQLKGLKARSLRVCKAWDNEAEGVSYVELAFRGVSRVRIVWSWPVDWGSIPQGPRWWPDVGMPFKRSALFLFVQDEWHPHGHAAVSPRSRYWWRAGDNEETWLGYSEPIALSGEQITDPTDAFLALLARGVLGKDGQELSPDAAMSDSLRTVWKNLSKRIGAVGSEHATLETGTCP